MGTFLGVFVPCVQNILGTILYLRLSWIVGQAGIGLTLAIVAICCCTTFLTSLSLSAIATNGSIKGGGPYYLISRALGPEFGGSVGLCFYLGTTVAGSMYILGAVQTLKDTIPALQITGTNCTGLSPLANQCGVCEVLNLNDYRIFGIFVLLLCSMVVFGGVRYVSMISPFMLIPVLISVLLIWLGIAFASMRDFDSASGITGDWSTNIPANMNPAFEVNEACLTVTRDDGTPYFTEVESFDFWKALALFFPSVTGIMAGSNRSGDLRNAQVSIPFGTLAAVLFTSSIYLLTVVLYGGVAERQVGLKTNYLLSADASIEAGVVRVGIILSSLGAGLQSLTGAPRLLQAIANDDLMPILRVFQGEGEPRRPLALTTLICLGCVLTGEIDIVAPFITMFFLLCYTAVNSAVLLQGVLREPNWRPRFQYYNSGTALLGAVLCLTIMFTTFLTFAIGSLLVVSILYKYIQYRKVAKHWGDGMRGIRMQTARQMLLALERLSSVHTKNWRPQVLLFAKVTPDAVLHQPGLLPFVAQLKGARGITIIATAIEGDLLQDAALQMRVERKLREVRDDHEIRGFTQVVMSDDVPTALDSLLQTAGLGGLGPNTVVTCWPTSWRERLAGARYMKRILTSGHAFNMALILIKGVEEWPDSLSVLHGPIDIWWVVHDGGLLLLLATILRKHRTWRHTALRVFVVCQPGDDAAELHSVIKTFLYNMRMSAELHVKQLDALLSGILPTRGAEWSTRDGGVMPRVDRAIVATPLGALDVAEATSYRTAGHEPSKRADAAARTMRNKSTLSSSSTSSGQSPPFPPTPGDATPSPITASVPMLAASSDGAPTNARPTASMDELEIRKQATRGLNRMLVEHSAESALVMTNLPLPKEEDEPGAYMEHLELLLFGIPRALLVAGQRDAEVITMYS